MDPQKWHIHIVTPFSGDNLTTHLYNFWFQIVVSGAKKPKFWYIEDSVQWKFFGTQRKFYETAIKCIDDLSSMSLKLTGWWGRVDVNPLAHWRWHLMRAQLLVGGMAQLAGFLFSNTTKEYISRHCTCAYTDKGVPARRPGIPQP